MPPGAPDSIQALPRKVEFPNFIKCYFTKLLSNLLVDNINLNLVNSRSIRRRTVWFAETNGMLLTADCDIALNIGCAAASDDGKCRQILLWSNSAYNSPRHASWDCAPRGTRVGWVMRIQEREILGRNSHDPTYRPSGCTG